MSHSGETVFGSDQHVLHLCEKFTALTLNSAEPEVNTICHAAITNNYLGDRQQKTLEQCLCKIYNFLATLEQTLKKPKAPPMPKVKLPPKPQVTHSPNPTLSYEEQRLAQQLRDQINALRKELKEQNQIVTDMKKNLHKQMAIAEEKRRRVRAKLAQVQPALDEANAGLSSVKDEQLYEVRSYSTPPPTVAKVMTCVLVLLGETEKQASNWDTICSFLRNKEFIPQVRDFDPHKVTDGDRLQAKRLAYDKSLSIERAEKASKAAAPLYRWVLAMINYVEVLQSVRPLEAELERLNAEIAKMQSEIDERTRVGGMRELRDMERQYQRQFGEEELERRRNEVRKQDELRNVKLRAQWNKDCITARQQAMAKRTRPPPQVVLTEQGDITVSDCKRRCQVLIDAISATMSALEAAGGIKCARPLVVQRGRMDLDNTLLNEYEMNQRRAQSPIYTRARDNSPPNASSYPLSPPRQSSYATKRTTTRAATPSGSSSSPATRRVVTRSGILTPTGYLSHSTQRLVDNAQKQRMLSGLYADPHHDGLIMDDELATGSTVLFVGSNAEHE